MYDITDSHIAIFIANIHLTDIFAGAPFGQKMISPKQKKILAFPYSSYDALICDGAVRSGKTSIEVVAFVDWAMREFNNRRFGICGKTVKSATENMITPYIALSYAKKKYTLHWRSSKQILEVRRGRRVNYFEVFGGRDESSFALIQGRTLAGVLLDEVVLMPQSFVEQALARCSVEGSRIWFSCNPGNPKHWFKQEWINKHKEHNALYLHFSMRDNPSLSEKMLARYESMYSGVFHDRYVKGLWVSADGLVYKYFANNTEEFLIDDPIVWCRDHNRRINRVMIGVDFGGTKSFTAFKAVGITNGGVVIVLDEEHIDSNDLDPDRLNKLFRDFVLRIQSVYGESQTRADNEESVLIRGLSHTAQKNRLLTTVKNAIKMPINDRIRLTILLMAQKRLFVARKCVHMIDAFQTAVYDSEEIDDVRLDDGTSDIDSLDAFEYTIEPWYKQLEAAGFMGVK